MEDVAIIGVGLHPWGKWQGKHFLQLGQEAVDRALEDAGLEWKDIPFVVAGISRFHGMTGLGAGNVLSGLMGNRGIPIINVWNACATGGYTLLVARDLVASGRCDKVLCVAADESPGGFYAPADTGDPNDMILQRFRIGMVNPSWWALLTQRRMHEVGTTEADIADVKVKNSRCGALNPNARYRKVYTRDEVMASPLVLSPLRLYEICATSDGAAAVIVCSAREARKYSTKPVLLSSVSCSSLEYPEAEPHFSFASDTVKADVRPSLGGYVRRAIPNAYEEAGLGPEDLSFAEAYDLATSLELFWYEHLGLCDYGEAEGLLRSGATGLGGRIPVNPSGGLSSFGEAVPAQGLCQVYELVRQLRGEGGARQVANAKVGLAANVGQFGNCSCMILRN